MEQVLYPLPEGWHLETIGEVASKLFTGKTPSTKKAEYYSSSEVDWFTPSDFGSTAVLNNSRRKLSSLAIEDGTIKKMPKGSILLVAIGATIGKVGLAEDESCFNQQVTGIHFKEKIHPKYAYYWLSYIKPEIITKSSQATLPIINQTGIKALSFLYPEKEEQKRIVEKLDALLTRIDTAIEHLQESVTLADALYASTINEQMMQAIELAGLSTVEKHIEQIQTGTTPPTKQPEFYENGDINWFAPSDFGDHDILFDSNKKLSQKAFDAGKARKFDAGTIMLVAIGATIGKIGYLEQDASSNQQITGMKFNSAIIPRYAYYWFRFIKPEILTNASTATLPIINQKGIKALSFCAPNKQLQETICRKIDEVSNFRNKVKAELNEKVELMRSLKASILDSAFKGEL
ncbi:restriction endonuclease subunit S [Vibrio cholerae]|uniref:restriction endonuclease subunit S n=1 Tax=Vibrio cholerae TaxID=666 RepID=UPI00226FCBB1|nr:restriction endonuclease subunit S [Vibrio cholerae]MCX9558305.1 restriction endonuclease subunit S [Vibrio cholerae]MCX9560896.1 restriction endonuclease subunit S [Vibrio cholerae]